MPIVDGPGKTTPPPARKPAQTRKPAAPNVTPDDIRKRRTDAANEFWGMASAGALAFGQWADAATFQLHGPAITDGVVDLANRSEKIAAGLDRFAEMLPALSLATAVVPMILQLATNHRIVPVDRAAMFGAESPEVLASEMRMKVKQQLFQREQEAKAREARLDEMQRQIREQDTTAPVESET